MKNMVYGSVIITLLTLVLVLCKFYILMSDVDRMIPTVNSTLLQVQSTLASVQTIETNTTRTEAELAGLLNTTRHIALSERDQEAKQFVAVQQLSTDAFQLVNDADAAVKNLGDVAPNLTESIQHMTSDVHNTMVSSQALMGAATLTISSPAIAQTEVAAMEAAQHTAIATQNLADTTQDIKVYVHRETTPVRGTWNFIKGLINQTWAIRGAIGL